MERMLHHRRQRSRQHLPARTLGDAVIKNCVEHLRGGGGRLVPQSFKTALPSMIESPIISLSTLAPNQHDAEENSWLALTAFNGRSPVNSSWQSSNERRINLKKSGHHEDTEPRALP
jgi:hypothetical protein